MDGQSSVFVALFVKALILAVGAATGLLAVVVALAFGMAISHGITSLFRKLKGVVKRKPKENKQSTQVA